MKQGTWKGNSISHTNCMFLKSICTEKKEVSVVIKGKSKYFTIYPRKMKFETVRVCVDVYVGYGKQLKLQHMVCARKSIFFSTPVLSWVNPCRWGNWNDFVNAWNYVTRSTFLQHTDAAVCNVNSLSKLTCSGRTKNKMRRLEQNMWWFEGISKESLESRAHERVEYLERWRSISRWMKRDKVSWPGQMTSASKRGKWYISTKYQSNKMNCFFFLNVE